MKTLTSTLLPEFVYELDERRIALGQTELVVNALRNLDHTIDALFDVLEKRNQPELLESLCPYFGTLWPAARALADWVARRDVSGRTVLELGCGLALPSLVAARAGARSVVATDFHPEVPRFLAINLEANGLEGRVDYRELDWQKLGEIPKQDLVLASDVLYERYQAAALVRAIGATLAPSGVACVTDPGRPYGQPFVDEARKAGFKETTLVERLALPDGRTQDVFVIELRRS